MTIIIGLTGKARHGKGSVVQLSQILLQLGDDELEVRQVSFATELKRMGNDIVVRVNRSLTGAAGVFDMLTGRGLPDNVALELIELAKGLTPEDLKAKTPRARKFLQFLGTEAFRVHVDDLYWVKVAAKKIQEMPPDTKVVFIPDCRFINEADYIRKMGGLLWRVERLNRDGTPFDNGLTAEQKMHPSEVQLDGYPVDSTLVAADMDELFHAVRKQLEQIQKDGKL